MSSCKKKKGEHFSNSFCRTSSILIPKPEKDIKRKENYTSLSFITGTKFLNKRLTNQIQQTTKRIIP